MRSTRWDRWSRRKVTETPGSLRTTGSASRQRRSRIISAIERVGRRGRGLSGRRRRARDSRGAMYNGTHTVLRPMILYVPGSGGAEEAASDDRVDEGALR